MIKAGLCMPGPCMVPEVGGQVQGIYLLCKSQAQVKSSYCAGSTSHPTGSKVELCHGPTSPLPASRAGQDQRREHAPAL